MSATASQLADTGLEVTDLANNHAFAGRQPHLRDASRQLKGMQCLARAFVDSPDTILKQLVDVAVELCGAESAGISLQKPDATEDSFYQWVATSGQFSPFLNAELPRNPSACSLCLERGRPQHFRVTQKFYDVMGVVAPPVSDGILLPWKTGDIRGTIWIMAHDREEAFDTEDVQTMQVLADFAAMAIRQQRQQELLIEQAAATAVATMANDLAHKINNPLQSLTNLLYLATQSQTFPDSRSLALEMSEDFDKLSRLVAKILTLPIKPPRQT